MVSVSFFDGVKEKGFFYIFFWLGEGSFSLSRSHRCRRRPRVSPVGKEGVREKTTRVPSACLLFPLSCFCLSPFQAYDSCTLFCYSSTFAMVAVSESIFSHPFRSISD